MKTAMSLVAAVLLTACFGCPVLAISTLDDTLRDLPRISRTPSTFPPNNAVHRNPMGRRGNNIGHEDNNDMRDAGSDQSAGPNIVSAESAPWAVALSEGPELDKNFLCAGVLVAPTWVVTAAHCTYSIARRWPNDTGALVYTRTANLAAPGRRFAVTQIVPHPQYDARALRNDIALVKIDAKGATAGQPIRLEGPRHSQQTGEIVSILGWGITTPKFDRQHRENLQVIQGAVLDDGVCFSTPNFPALRGTSVFCARSLIVHHDVCFRFGGSPMVIYDDAGRLYLLGLVSWPATCPSEGHKPNIYLDVQAYVPWIKSVIDASR